ncbi:unnamed protein product [Arctia plantaginis]|uniref:Gamma-tubulin complex component n=1 Tax=Arctia plantaginis TaxID=874455 RepID=A0A8S0ZS03_ARCPL|nr:unnamed protein product [Arctia plantaginis]
MSNTLVHKSGSPDNILKTIRVHNVDEVLERHNDFLESCLGDCMLTSPQLLKAVTTLCLVCVQFCTFIQDTGCGGSKVNGSSDSFARSVSRYGLRFTAALLSVLAIIERMARDNNTNKLLNISARLNFNTYYVKQLEKLCSDEQLLEGERKAAPAS